MPNKLSNGLSLQLQWKFLITAYGTSLAHDAAWHIVGANEWMTTFFPNNTIKLANHDKSAETTWFK